MQTLFSQSRASKCLEEGKAQMLFGFVSGWDWHMLTRSRRTVIWKDCNIARHVCKLRDRQDHCRVQMGCSIKSDGILLK